MKSHFFIHTVGVLVSSLALAAPGVAAKDKKDAAQHGKYRPAIDPRNFTHIVSNPYFPLVPGTTFTFVEKEGSETRKNTVTVMRDTKFVMGVKCMIVHDTVTVDGKVKEDTFDWYAQDKEGAVWYFGEATREYKSRGSVSTAGSWEAGVSGQPGIIMPAEPKPGRRYRQEYSPGNAEDMGQVVAVGETVSVPHGTFKDCVKTKDWSLLESGHEHKWYAKAVGLVRTKSSSGEEATLISVTRK